MQVKIEGWRGLVLFSIQVKINLWTVGAPDLPLAKVSHSHHLVQTFQTNFSLSSYQQYKSPSVCVWIGGREEEEGYGWVGWGDSLALHPARANSAIWTDDRMFLTYHQK